MDDDGGGGGVGGGSTLNIDESKMKQMQYEQLRVHLFFLLRFVYLSNRLPLTMA